MRFLRKTAYYGLLVQSAHYLCIDIEYSDIRQAAVAHRRAKEILDPLHCTKGALCLC